MKKTIFLLLCLIVLFVPNVYAQTPTIENGILYMVPPDGYPDELQATNGENNTDDGIRIWSGESRTWTLEEPTTITHYLALLGGQVFFRLYNGEEIVLSESDAGNNQIQSLETPIEGVTSVNVISNATLGRYIYQINVWGYPTDELYPELPEAPAGLKVINVGDRTATISWDHNDESDLAGYNVYLDGESVNETVITDTSFIFDGLNNRQTYTAQVSAVDEAGQESPLSAAVTFTPEVDEPPAAPTGLSATPGVEQVILNWNGNTEPDLIGYYVYRDGTRISSIISGTTYTDTGRTPGTEYSYTVTAVDEAENESEPSEAVTVTTRTQYAIVPPPNIRAKPDRQSMEIVVNWSAVPDATTYKLFKNGDNIIDTTLTSYTDTDVQPGQVYKYQVASVVDGEESGMSNVAQAKILEEFDFENPMNLTTTDVVQTAWNFIKPYEPYLVVVGGVIFSYVLVTFIFRRLGLTELARYEAATKGAPRGNFGKYGYDRPLTARERNTLDSMTDTTEYSKIRKAMIQRKHEKADEYYAKLTRERKFSTRDAWARETRYVRPNNREAWTRPGRRLRDGRQ